MLDAGPDSFPIVRLICYSTISFSFRHICDPSTCYQAASAASQGDKRLNVLENECIWANRDRDQFSWLSVQLPLVAMRVTETNAAAKSLANIASFTNGSRGLHVSSLTHRGCCVCGSGSQI